MSEPTLCEEVQSEEGPHREGAAWNGVSALGLEEVAGRMLDRLHRDTGQRNKYFKDVGNQVSCHRAYRKWGDQNELLSVEYELEMLI